ncbi:hypothetical protein BGW80DRAFT_1461974 [Lactifluus volemus]|nr:hypothetical protein BGW80DRAFT_1461974 [Lactifluus volemus]
MQRFTVALFVLLALFALLVPLSSANNVEPAKRETNADRLARGLPPLAPTRRHAARRFGRPSIIPSFLIRSEFRDLF